VRYREEQMWDDRIPAIANKEKSQLVEALVDPEMSQALPARIGRSLGLKEEVRRYQEAEKYLYPRDIVRSSDKVTALQQDHEPPTLMPKDTLSIMEGTLAGRPLKVLEEEKYGEGAFGEVIGVELPGGGEAVMKKWLQAEKASKAIIRECAANLVFAEDLTLGVVPVLAMTKEGLILEKLNGCTFFSWAKHCTEADITRILKTMAGYLDAIHEKGYVFGDLKLENMFFNIFEDDGNQLIEPLLIDCGGVAEIGRKKGAITWSYLAPELVQDDGTRKKGMPLNQQTDVYAFGIALFRLLKRNKVMEPKTAKDFHRYYARIQTDVTRGVAHEQGGTKKLYELVQQCTHINPAARPSFEMIWTHLNNTLSLFYDGITLVDIDPPGLFY